MPIKRKVTTTKEEIEEYDNTQHTTDIPINLNETSSGSSIARKIETGSDLQPESNENDVSSTTTDTNQIGRTWADVLREVMHTPRYIVVSVYMLSLFFTMKRFSWFGLWHSIIVGTFLCIVFFIAQLIEWRVQKKKVHSL